MSGVNIALANGQLGQTVQTEDGVVGLVVTGETSEDLVDALGTPYRITKFADLATKGITATDNEFAVNQVKDFYAAAGTGAVLYLMLVPNTMTVADMADETVPTGAKLLLDYAEGKIKVLGVICNDASAETAVTAGISAEIPNALVNMQVLANSYADQQKPFRGIIAGTSYQGTPASLVDLSTATNNRCMVVIGTTGEQQDIASGLGCFIGLTLGVIGSLPVQRKISRVANGSLPMAAAYLAGETVENVPADSDAIAEKGYVTVKKFAHRSGYYFTGDAMACLPTDDYGILARGRIMDKAQVIIYDTMLDEVDDEVPVDPETGKLDAAYCKYLETQINKQIELTMAQNNEVVSVSTFVDPEQNVLSTNEILVNVGIVPYGYSSVINITLGFTNPAI